MKNEQVGCAALKVAPQSCKMLPRYARYASIPKVRSPITVQACFLEVPFPDSRVHEGTTKSKRYVLAAASGLLEGATQHFCVHFIDCNFVSRLSSAQGRLGDGVTIYSGPKPAKY